MNHSYYMQRALDLASLALGNTSPNPVVGCVIVKDEQIIADGYHQQAGHAHAEVMALDKLGTLAQGATMYVTLEPCAHYGKTPPCINKIIAAGIKQVYVAMLDPNPLVAGKGVKALEQANIQVHVGLMETEAIQLNEVFIKWILTHKPFIVSKLAMSLDGKIATVTGESKWITNPSARSQGHYLRQIYDAILVGVNTVIADDPLLTVRNTTNNLFQQPIRLILDSHGRTPINAQVIQDKTAKSFIITSKNCPIAKIEQYKSHNIQVIIAATKNNQVDINDALKQLSDYGIQSILLEGGTTIHGAFYDLGIIDKIHAFIGSNIIGGKDALSAIAGQGIPHLTDVMQLEFSQANIIDNNLHITAYNKKREGQYVHWHN